MAKVTLFFGSDNQGEYALDKAELTIGRSRDCDIVVDNLGVSRHHCSIVQAGGAWKVVDRGSNNGTFLNDAQIDGEQVLKDRDRIVLGKFSLLFDAAGTVDEAAQEVRRQTAAKSMGSEMTMFVDPEAIKQMQAKMKAGGAATGARMALSIKQGGREMNCMLVKDETTIGKGIEADVPVKGFLVKPVQAKVVRADNGFRLVSAGGLRAVKVNDRAIREAVLKPGDVIRIAGTVVFFKQMS